MSSFGHSRCPCCGTADNVVAEDTRIGAGPVVRPLGAEDRRDIPGVDSVPPNKVTAIFTAGIVFTVVRSGCLVVANCIGDQRAGYVVGMGYAPAKKGEAPKRVLVRESALITRASHQTFWPSTRVKGAVIVSGDVGGTPTSPAIDAAKRYGVAKKL